MLKFSRRFLAMFFLPGLVLSATVPTGRPNYFKNLIDCGGLLQFVRFEPSAWSWGIIPARVPERQPLLSPSSWQIAEEYGIRFEIDLSHVIVFHKSKEIGRFYFSGLIERINVFLMRDRPSHNLTLFISVHGPAHYKIFKLQNALSEDAEDQVLLEAASIPLMYVPSLSFFLIKLVTQAPHSSNSKDGAMIKVEVPHRRMFHSFWVDHNELAAAMKRFGVSSVQRLKGQHFYGPTADAERAFQLLRLNLERPYEPPQYDALYNHIVDSFLKFELPNFDDIDSATRDSAIKAAFKDERWLSILNRKLLDASGGSIWIEDAKKEDFKTPFPGLAKYLKLESSQGQSKLLIFSMHAEPFRFDE
jgi:hypothetical protein